MKINIEGWRYYPHSYALVNMWQCLALLDRGAEIGFTDAPPLDWKWQHRRGLLSIDQEARLAALPGPFAAPDVTYRISLPLRLQPAPIGRTFVFATADYQWLPSRMIEGGVSLKEALGPDADQQVELVSPSEFSKRGLVRSGAMRVTVIPHGVDRVFCDTPQRFVSGPLSVSEIDPPQFRRQSQGRAPVSLNVVDHANELGTGPRDGRIDKPTLLNVSDMTRRKGLDVLLRAFAQLLHRRAGTLLLKGLGDFSRRHFEAAFQALAQSDRALIAPHVRYIGDEMNVATLAELYRSADVYVSPYRAESFNMPVAEAIACGLPVVCTGGGPTDEFASGAIRIDSRIVARGIEIEEAILEPDADDTLVKILDALRLVGRDRERIDATPSWLDVADRMLALFSHSVSAHYADCRSPSPLHAI